MELQCPHCHKPCCPKNRTVTAYDRIVKTVRSLYYIIKKK